MTKKKRRAYKFYFSERKGMNAKEGNVYPAPLALSLTHSHSFKLMFGTQGEKKGRNKKRKRLTRER